MKDLLLIGTGFLIPLSIVAVRVVHTLLVRYG